MCLLTWFSIHPLSTWAPILGFSVPKYFLPTFLCYSLIPSTDTPGFRQTLSASISAQYVLRNKRLEVARTLGHDIKLQSSTEVQVGKKRPGIEKWRVKKGRESVGRIGRGFLVTSDASLNYSEVPWARGVKASTRRPLWDCSAWYAAQMPFQ